MLGFVFISESRQSFLYYLVITSNCAEHQKCHVELNIKSRLFEITENDYDKDVFNGDLGYIKKIDKINETIDVLYDDKVVNYDFKELDMLIHSYAITIHKSQGSEYPVVIIPIHTQHYVMLKRTLFYTALTRARKLAVIVGSVKAMRLAVKQTDTSFRTTMLTEKLL